jgi:hypothetical protein
MSEWSTGRRVRMEHENKSKALISLVTPTGFEPVTPRLGNWFSLRTGALP